MKPELFLPLAKQIPMPVLAGILVVVCKNMIEIEAIRGLLKAPWSDRLLLIATFILTVVFDLVVAIQVGLLMAARYTHWKNLPHTVLNIKHAYFWLGCRLSLRQLLNSQRFAPV
jgi:MFS superfamily sulfate permease-like transporter